MKGNIIKNASFYFLVVAVLQTATFAQEIFSIQEKRESLDPYGKKAVLGYVLRLPIFLDLLSVELQMTEAQKDTLSQIVKSEEKELDELYRSPLNYSPESYEEKYHQILLNTDIKLRKILNPLQYAKLRDWIIEQWLLERGEASPPLDEIVNIGTHCINLLKSQLNLSPNEQRKISSLMAQYKSEILPLRKKLISLAQNPLTTWDKLETEGGKIIQNVKMLTEKVDKIILESLSPEQRVIYQAIKVK
jgi:hypothetical protein